MKISPNVLITQLAKLGEITGKTRVLYSELGEITGKTWVLPCGHIFIQHVQRIQKGRNILNDTQWKARGTEIISKPTQTGPSLLTFGAFIQNRRSRLPNHYKVQQIELSNFKFVLSLKDLFNTPALSLFQKKHTFYSKCFVEKKNFAWSIM